MWRQPFMVWTAAVDEPAGAVSVTCCGYIDTSCAKERVVRKAHTSTALYETLNPAIVG